MLLVPKMRAMRIQLLVPKMCVMRILQDLDCKKCIDGQTTRETKCTDKTTVWVHFVSVKCDVALNVFCLNLICYLSEVNLV